MSEFKFTEKEKDRIGDIMYGIAHTDVIDNIIDRIETVISEREQDGWVRVEDGLPEEGVPVNVYMSYGKIDVCHLRPPNLWIQSVRPQHSNGDVTHWQPLPNQPNPNK